MSPPWARINIFPLESWFVSQINIPLNFPVKWHPSKHANLAYGATCFVLIIGYFKRNFFKIWVKIKQSSDFWNRFSHPIMISRWYVYQSVTNVQAFVWPTHSNRASHQQDFLTSTWTANYIVCSSIVSCWKVYEHVEISAISSYEKI